MKKKKIANTKIYEYECANLDSSVMIRKDQRDLYHVRQTRKALIPGKPFEPIVTTWIKVYRKADWDFFNNLLQGYDGSGLSINPIVSAGLTEWVTVHDPRLEQRKAEMTEYQESRKKELKIKKGAI